MKTENVFELSDRTYQKLKYAVQFVLPGLGTLYFTLSQIWGFPFGEAVLGTISAVSLFLGVLIGISNYRYVPTGDIVVGEQDGATTFGFELNKLPEDFMNDRMATFNIRRGDLPGEPVAKTVPRRG